MHGQQHRGHNHRRLHKPWHRGTIRYCTRTRRKHSRHRLLHRSVPYSLWSADSACHRHGRNQSCRAVAVALLPMGAAHMCGRRNCTPPQLRNCLIIKRARRLRGELAGGEGYRLFSSLDFLITSAKCLLLLLKTSGRRNGSPIKFYLFVAWHKHFHDEPCCYVAQCTDAEHYHIACRLACETCK